MDIKEIKRLVSLVETANISHLSIDQDGVKIEIKKEGGLAGQGSTIVLPQTAAPVAAPEAPVAVPPVAKEAASNLIAVKSQMVGTFYISSSPDSPAYAKVGDTIKKGQTICIIEAMKLFNEIESEDTGTVEKVCVENGAPVEFGQTLFLLKP